MKVLLVGPYPPATGGVQVYMMELARALSELGHEPTVLSYSEAAPVGRERVIRLPTVGLSGLRGLSFISMAAAWISLRGGDFDLISAHYAKVSGISAFLAREVGGPDYMITFHGTDSLSSGLALLATRLAVFKARAVTAVSRFLARRVKARFGRRACVTPGAVWPEKYLSLPEREEAREILGLPRDAPVLAIVGSLVPVRRPTLALRTALSVRGAVALVVGGGPLEGSLKRLAAELSARDRVVFAGRVAHDRIPLFFRAADLSIHTPKFEGFGLSILESMAAGTPPAATPVGAIPDLVSDRETGVFIPEDPARAGEVIGELLSDRETLREMGERCVSVATSRSWLDVAEALLRAYREGCCSGG